MAAAEASFKISMLSMSEGLMSPNTLLAVVPVPLSPEKDGTPSITTSGKELSEIELMPLTLITGGLPITPFGMLMLTPAARPESPCSKVWIGWSRSLEPLICATLPVISRRRCVP